VGVEESRSVKQVEATKIEIGIHARAYQSPQLSCS
jgi:hypothetical protein